MNAATPAADTHPCLDVAELERFAVEYPYRVSELPICYSSEPYTRIVLNRDESVEIVLISGEQIHPLSNVDNNGTVLLNFYSPPFRT